MDVVCISLWQPWASLIVAGSKRVETRSWATNYRGPLYIHAAKKPCDLITDELTAGLMHVVDTSIDDWWTQLPYGAIVGRVNLVDCRRTDSFDLEIHRARVAREEDAADPLAWFTEYDLGNFGPGRYGWVLQNPLMLKEPIPYRGKQGLFVATIEDKIT